MADLTVERQDIEGVQPHLLVELAGVQAMGHGTTFLGSTQAHQDARYSVRLFFIIRGFDMAIADQSTRTTTSKISASNGWVLLGYTLLQLSLLPHRHTSYPLA